MIRGNGGTMENPLYKLEQIQEAHHHYCTMWDKYLPAESQILEFQTKYDIDDAFLMRLYERFIDQLIERRDYAIQEFESYIDDNCW